MIPILTQDISFFVAFLAGLVSFASPCILPMIPAYISYITGTMNYAERSLFRTISRSLAFILGFSIIFVIMGASASFLGEFFIDHRSLISKISGVLIVIFGLHMLGILKISFLYRQIRFQGPQKTASLFGATLMGMAFATGWTPCIGTVLSSILLYAGMEATVQKGIYLLSAYSLGLGIPFLVTGVLLHFFGQGISRLNRFTPFVTKISGGIMVLMGILIYFDLLFYVTQFLYF